MSFWIPERFGSPNSLKTTVLIGDDAHHGFANGVLRSLFGQSAATVGDELIQIKHGLSLQSRSRSHSLQKSYNPSDVSR